MSKPLDDHRLIEVESTSGVNWFSVSDLIAGVGWGQREPSELAAAFAKSTHVIFVYDTNELIGIGRTVDDGRYYASIVDVVVRPDFQKQGVGTRIVKRLQEHLEDYLIVSITAADEVQPFYQRLGWKPQRTAMLLPRNQKQEHLNCIRDMEAQ